MAKVGENEREEVEPLIQALYRGVLRRDPSPHDQDVQHLVEAVLNGRSYASVIEEFLGCEEFRLQTSTRLFVPPGHHYSPVVDIAEAEHHLTRLAAAPIPDSLPGISLDREALVRQWHVMLPALVSNPFPQEPTAPLRYAFVNEAYSWGDGSILHAMIRVNRPKRLIEVGCGWSSACSIDTIERYLDTPCDVTFIEPYPALLHGLIGEMTANLHVIASGVQNVGLEVFNQLEAGDILFIDSTHVLRTGSDVCYELFEILPGLAPGVLVHFHDMFWPFEYPRPWVIDENRSWNELYAMRAFLTSNTEWEIVFFNDFFGQFERPLIESTYPRFLLNPGGALWLRRRAPAA